MEIGFLLGLFILAIGISLKVAWLGEQLTRMERKLNALLWHHGVDLKKAPPLSERVKQLASDPAHKIDAIKAYREETGAELVDANAAIEVFIKSK